MDTSISVIIPFYNSIDTLSKMLDSILSGTIVPSEVILINDGSTDNSRELALEYAQKHTFIKIFDQAHCGASSARNLGLSKSNGTYISFLDADDFIEPDMFSTMLEAVQSDKENIDGCICGYFTHKEGVVTPYSKAATKFLSSAEILKSMYTDDSVRGFLFTRLFRKNTIKDLLFDTNVAICEDLLFQTQLFLTKQLTMAVIAKPLYHYVQRNDSATNTNALFENDTFIYKSVYEQLYNKVHESFVLTNYNSILEYSMYSLLKKYGATGDKSLRTQIFLLQKEMKSAKTTLPKSKRRIAFEIAPILYSHFMR